MNAPPLPPAYANLAAHALADMFPMIEGPAFETLKASISANGIRKPIALYEGKILDGRNRYKAGKETGHRFTPANFEEFKGTLPEAETYVIDINIHRRQLTDDDKKAFVRLMFAKHPGKGDRQIARLCGVSHSFVGKLREPKGDPVFDKFTAAWDNLSDQQRERFVTQCSADLRELFG